MAEPAALAWRDRRWAIAAAAACGLPLLVLLPVGLALGLVATGAIGALATRRTAWPAWLRALLALLLGAAVFGAYDFRFGRDAGCAMLLAMLALKVAESRSLRDARSLVGFGLFAGFAAFLQDQGLLTMALAVPGLVLALAAAQRLAEAEAGLAAPAAVGARVRGVGRALALALPLALVGFWLFPRLATPLWGLPQNAAAMPGVSGEMAPGDWLELLVDDSPAFRVRFLDPAPPPPRMYWRGVVLWDFDGQRWTRRPGFGAPPALAPVGPPIRYEVTLEPTERRFLFSLDLPRAAPEGARIGADFGVVAEAPVRSVLRYANTAWEFDAAGWTLPEAQRAAALSLPPDRNPRAAAAARAWRDAGADDAQVVREALAWFGREFSYSLLPPPLGRERVDEFLFETRVGYCEHFASAFVVLMRSAGVPARVVTGYAGGRRNRIDDEWVVRNSDAHAWAEVWLVGRGWVRVDPTAAVPQDRILDDGDGPPGPGRDAAESPLLGLLDVADWIRAGWTDLVLGYDAARQAMLLRPFGIARASGQQVAMAFIVAAGLALGLTLLVMLRGRVREPDPLLRAWRRFVRRFAGGPADKRADEPAGAWAERLAEAYPRDAGALRALVADFEALRYAPPGEGRDAAARQALAHRLRGFRPRRTSHHRA